MKNNPLPLSYIMAKIEQLIEIFAKTLIVLLHMFIVEMVKFVNFSDKILKNLFFLVLKSKKHTKILV